MLICAWMRKFRRWFTTFKTNLIALSWFFTNRIVFNCDLVNVHEISYLENTASPIKRRIIFYWCITIEHSFEKLNYAISFFVYWYVYFSWNFANSTINIYLHRWITNDTLYFKNIIFHTQFFIFEIWIIFWQEKKLIIKP